MMSKNSASGQIILEFLLSYRQPHVDTKQIQTVQLVYWSEHF